MIGYLRHVRLYLLAFFLVSALFFGEVYTLFIGRIVNAIDPCENHPEQYQEFASFPCSAVADVYALSLIAGILALIMFVWLISTIRYVLTKRNGGG